MRRLELSLAQLADRSGVPARTIRFYIARGLLEGPEKGGRDAVYTSQHLDRLAAIRKLQSNGLMLAEIGHKLAPVTPESEPISGENWAHYALADDVAVMVRADGSPWRQRQIRRALAEFRDRIRREETNE